MVHYTTRPGEDGCFHVLNPAGRRIAGPFPDRDAAQWRAEALTSDRWLLMIVQKRERSASPWDAYAKFFCHTGDGRCTEEQLLDWWLALPDGAYTRTRARVQVFDVTGRKWDLLAPGDARGVLDPAAPEPADPVLTLSFDPSALRKHFAGTRRHARLCCVSDRALAAAAREVVLSSDRLEALFADLCGEILACAARDAADGRS